jgi:hypothetical protein
LLNDANGQYRDAFGNVQQLKAPANAVYTSDGFWGTQWNLTPLWTLIAPEYAELMTNSLLELAARGGWIPEAPVALKYAPIMGAQHHNALIISCYQKGLRNFDVNGAYDAIKHDLSTPGIPHPSGGFAGNRHLSSYLKYGYVADEDGPISSTMEYAYDDWFLPSSPGPAGISKMLSCFLNVPDITQMRLTLQLVTLGAATRTAVGWNHLTRLRTAQKAAGTDPGSWKEMLGSIHISSRTTCRDWPGFWEPKTFLADLNRVLRKDMWT